MVTFAACGHTTNRTSQEAGTSAGTLGIITYISHDPPELCAAFMSYYIGTQRIKPSDVFVIEVDAIPEDAIRSCYERAKLPAANIHRPKPNRAHQWNEGYRIEMFHRFERLLLRRLRYTHVLIVDLDEFVLPSPQYGGQIYDYLQQSPYAQRGLVAPTSYIVMHAPSLGERDALEWATPGAALLADRRVWVRNCGGSKPVLLKHDPVKYTFSTHRVAQLPWYDPFQCLTNPRMAVRDCIDPALLSVHLKCVDSTLFKAAPLALPAPAPTAGSNEPPREIVLTTSPTAPKTHWHQTMIHFGADALAQGEAMETDEKAAAAGQAAFDCTVELKVDPAAPRSYRISVNC